MKKIKTSSDSKPSSLEEIQRSYDARIINIPIGYPDTTMLFVGSLLSPEEISQSKSLVYAHFNPEFAAKNVLVQYLDGLNIASQQEHGENMSDEHVIFINTQCFHKLWANKPIGFVYGIRATRGIEVRDYLNAGSVTPEVLRQLVVVDPIRADDVLCYRPLYQNLSQNSVNVRKFRVSAGEIIANEKHEQNNSQNNNFYDGTDENHAKFLGLSTVGYLFSDTQYYRTAANNGRVERKLTQFEIKDNEEPVLAIDTNLEDSSDNTYSASESENKKQKLLEEVASDAIDLISRERGYGSQNDTRTVEKGEHSEKFRFSN